MYMTQLFVSILVGTAAVTAAVARPRGEVDASRKPLVRKEFRVFHNAISLGCQTDKCGLEQEKLAS